MINSLFVNLPVADLEATQAFWRRLGFDFNPHFTNDKAACLVLGPNISAMLLTPGFFAGFTGKAIADARAVTECINALQVESRAEVERLVAAAIAAGGTAPRPPQDHGFMFQHGFEDLDGHIWEVFHMDAPPVQQA